jgi:hypothetical protein
MHKNTRLKDKRERSLRSLPLIEPKDGAQW